MQVLCVKVPLTGGLSMCALNGWWLAENIGGGGVWFRIPIGGCFCGHVINCADYYVYGSGGVPTSQRGVGGTWVRARARIEMTPTRVRAHPCVLYPRVLRVVSACCACRVRVLRARVARRARVAPVCVRCACRARVARRERVRVIRFGIARLCAVNKLNPNKNNHLPVNINLFCACVTFPLDRVTVSPRLGTSKRRTTFHNSQGDREQSDSFGKHETKA